MTRHNRIQNQIINGAKKFRARWGRREYATRIAVLSQDAQLVLAAFYDDRSVDDVLDALAARLHRGHGRITDSELFSAQMKLADACHELLVQLEIERY